METVSNTTATLPQTAEISLRFNQHPMKVAAERLKNLRHNIAEAENFAREFTIHADPAGVSGWQNRMADNRRVFGDSRFAELPAMRELERIITESAEYPEICDCMGLIDLLADCLERDRVEAVRLAEAVQAARDAEAAAAQRLAMQAATDPAVIAARQKILALGGSLSMLAPDAQDATAAPESTSMQAQDFAGPVADPADLALTAEPAAQVEKPGVARVKKSPFQD